MIEFYGTSTSDSTLPDSDNSDNLSPVENFKSRSSDSDSKPNSTYIGDELKREVNRKEENLSNQQPTVDADSTAFYLDKEQKQPIVDPFLNILLL